MPDEPDENEYHIPLDDLTGHHSYALARGDEDSDEPLDPGASVAYVASEIRPRPSPLTIEGMIAGIGAAAQGAAKEDHGWKLWTMRTLAFAFVAPTVVLLLLRAVGVR